MIPASLTLPEFLKVVTEPENVCLLSGVFYVEGRMLEEGLDKL